MPEYNGSQTLSEGEYIPSIVAKTDWVFRIDSSDDKDAKSVRSSEPF